MGIRATVQEGGKPPESSLGRGPPGGGRGPRGSIGEGARDSVWGRSPPPPADTLSPFLAPVALDTQCSTVSVPGQVPRETPRTRPGPASFPGSLRPAIEFSKRETRVLGLASGSPSSAILKQASQSVQFCPFLLPAPEFQPNHLKTALTRETVHRVLH